MLRVPQRRAHQAETQRGSHNSRLSLALLNKIQTFICFSLLQHKLNSKAVHFSQQKKLQLLKATLLLLLQIFKTITLLQIYSLFCHQ